MNRTHSLLGCAVIAVTLLLGSAQADPIVGDLTIGGIVKLDNTSLGLASGITSGSGMVFIGTGDFATTEGSLVEYHPFTWGPASTPVNPLWTFTRATMHYSFTLTSITVASQDKFFLDLSGTGFFHIDGKDDTPGTWAYSTSDSDGRPNANFKFGFTSSLNTLPVPDGGNVLILAGLAVIFALPFRKRVWA